MPAGYVAETTADVALTAATAKTILSIINGSNATIRLVEASISFDGTSSSAEPVTVELCFSTEATAGTATSQSLVQTRGATRTPQCSAKRNFTAEPTVLTVVRQWRIHPQTGITYPLPLGREIEQITTADAICLRGTAPANVNCGSHMEVEEG